MSFAISVALPSNKLQLETSKKASSKDKGSIILVYRENISCMSSEAFRYFSISGRIMMSSGQRFLAIDEAIAE